MRLADGHWLVVEPTPGYAVLAPEVPLTDRVRAALATAAAWARRHAAALALAAVVGVAAWVRRRRLIDAAAVRLWVWFPGRTWRDRVRRAVRILERRGRWAGTPRNPLQTVTAWARTAGPDAELARLARMAEWAAYAPETPPPWPADEVSAVCRRVLAGWTPRTRPDPNPTPANGERP